ncbi:TnsD family transposase [Alicyclobacillus sp. TC]|uniref:TnsD family transposase n=1 Tax=Alicyclobacillus sp. TC TaxID=2606450 RepID=UPI002107DF76|nr:TnsD family transposase [Alicyclobacillus sp. TC]
MLVQIHPYPDELVISMVARYHMYSGRAGVKESLRDVYGLDSVRPSLHLPSHLQRLSESGCFGVSARTLVYEHTLFPYYAPFLKPEMAAHVMNDMLSDNSLGVHLESGLVPSRVSMPTRLVTCPACIHDDIHTHGEPYWHRAHHLPGVISCPKHKVKLYDRCPTCGIPFTGLFIQELPFPVVACPNGHSLLNTEGETRPATNRIAMDSEFILNNTPTWKSLEELRDRYVNVLYAMGMATPSGSIRQRDLFERFITYFPAELWGVIGVAQPVRDQECDWLRELVRKPRKALHPLFHILLMEFLSGDVPRFFEQNRFEPFGHGPWPCLNKAATHYMQDIVRDLTVTRCTDTGRPVGTFRCECGFVYSRRGPDRTEKDRFRYGRIKEFGPVWEEKLHTLASDGRWSLRGLARELGVDPKVITARLEKQNLSNVAPNTGEQEERERRRRRFMETLRTNPRCSRSRLKQLNYRDYQWLYRHDRDWLDCILPRPIVSGVRSERRVDWAQRDREMSVFVEQIAQCILNQPGKPVRVTVGRIGRICGKKALLEKCLDKLPLTEHVLNKYVESRSEFCKRRVDWAMAELLCERTDAAPWQIIRKAGLRTPVSQELNDYIEQRLIEAVEQRDDSRGVDDASRRIS